VLKAFVAAMVGMAWLARKAIRLFGGFSPPCRMGEHDQQDIGRHGAAGSATPLEATVD